MKILTVILVAVFLTGCGGTWFPEKDYYGAYMSIYKSTEYSKKKTLCQRSISHLSPELNVGVFHQCMNRTVIY